MPVARGAAPAVPLTDLEQAQRTLTALAGHARVPAERRALASAAAAVGRGTAPTLWLDSRHAVAPAYGYSVFAESRAALIDLEHVAGGSLPSGALAGAVTQILAGNRLLTLGAILQALHGPGGLLARARGMVLSGDRWAATSRFDLAAEQYGAGWREAFQALTEHVVVRTMLVSARALSTAAERALGNRRISPAGVRLVSGRSTLTESGKPEVLFVGTESCRFCAVERWGLVVALSRFGTFSNLHLSQSTPTAPPAVRSFTFAGARYVSPYVSLAAVELSGQVPRPGGGHEPLERLSGPERRVFLALDPRGTTPFVDVENRAVDVGATVSPALLGESSWPALAGLLRRPRAAPAQAIAATAEVLTAEICESIAGAPPAGSIAGARPATSTAGAPPTSSTAGGPPAVCGSAVVQDYSRRLARFSAPGGGCPVTPAEVRRATEPATR